MVDKKNSVQLDIKLGEGLSTDTENKSLSVEVISPRVALPRVVSPKWSSSRARAIPSKWSSSRARAISPKRSSSKKSSDMPGHRRSRSTQYFLTHQWSTITDDFGEKLRRLSSDDEFNKLLQEAKDDPLYFAQQNIQQPNKTYGDSVFVAESRLVLSEQEIEKEISGLNADLSHFRTVRDCLQDKLNQINKVLETYEEALSPQAEKAESLTIELIQARLKRTEINNQIEHCLNEELKEKLTEQLLAIESAAKACEKKLTEHRNNNKDQVSLLRTKLTAALNNFLWFIETPEDLHDNSLKQRAQLLVDRFTQNLNSLTSMSDMSLSFDADNQKVLEKLREYSSHLEKRIEDLSTSEKQKSSKLAEAMRDQAMVLQHREKLNSHTQSRYTVGFSLSSTPDEVETECRFSQDFETRQRELKHKLDVYKGKISSYSKQRAPFPPNVLKECRAMFGLLDEYITLGLVQIAQARKFHAEPGRSIEITFGYMREAAQMQTALMAMMTDAEKNDQIEDSDSKYIDARLDVSKNERVSDSDLPGLMEEDSSGSEDSDLKYDEGFVPLRNGSISDDEQPALTDDDSSDSESSDLKYDDRFVSPRNGSMSDDEQPVLTDGDSSDEEALFGALDSDDDGSSGASGSLETPEGLPRLSTLKRRKRTSSSSVSIMAVSTNQSSETVSNKAIASKSPMPQHATDPDLETKMLPIDTEGSHVPTRASSTLSSPLTPSTQFMIGASNAPSYSYELEKAESHSEEMESDDSVAIAVERGNVSVSQISSQDIRGTCGTFNDWRLLGVRGLRVLTDTGIYDRLDIGDHGVWGRATEWLQSNISPRRSSGDDYVLLDIGNGVPLIGCIMGTLGFIAYFVRWGTDSYLSVTNIWTAEKQNDPGLTKVRFCIRGVKNTLIEMKNFIFRREEDDSNLSQADLVRKRENNIRGFEKRNDAAWAITNSVNYFWANGVEWDAVEFLKADQILQESTGEAAIEISSSFVSGSITLNLGWGLLILLYFFDYMNTKWRLSDHEKEYHREETQRQTRIGNIQQKLLELKRSRLPDEKRSSDQGDVDTSTESILKLELELKVEEETSRQMRIEYLQQRINDKISVKVAQYLAAFTVGYYILSMFSLALGGAPIAVFQILFSAGTLFAHIASKFLKGKISEHVKQIANGNSGNDLSKYSRALLESSGAKEELDELKTLTLVKQDDNENRADIQEASGTREPEPVSDSLQQQSEQLTEDAQEAEDSTTVHSGAPACGC
jgi:hypothetical protein